MAKKKVKKDLCSKQISFRCTEKEAKWIKKLADQKGMQQKKFIMECIQISQENGKKETKREINMAACASYTQGLVNYLQRNYKNDISVEEVCKKLWDLVY